MFTEQLTAVLSQYIGKVPYLLYAVALLLGVPITLLIATVVLVVTGQTRPRLGALIGLCTGVWASMCWLTIPYIGGYPNLLGCMLLLPFLPIDNPSKEVTIHITNLILWPGLGACLFAVAHNLRNRKQGPSK